MLVFKYIMTKFSVEIKTLASICLLMAFSCSSLTVKGRRPTCPQSTHYTVFDPSNQEGNETCRICPICLPAYGLPIQCGNRIANGTSTDCKPCVNGTYSKNNDSSECKSCDKCEGLNVEKQCTPQENSKCGTCPLGYYYDAYVEDCKECFHCCDDVLDGDRLKECKDLRMPWNKQCEATDANKKCKMLKALSSNSTTAKPITTVSPLSKHTGAIGSTGTATPPSGITANNSTTNNTSKLHPVNINETEIIHKSVGEDHGSSGGKRYIIIAVLVPGGIIVILGIISYFVVKKPNQSRNGDPEQVNGTTTQLLENQNTVISATSFTVNGTTTQLLENQNTVISATSFTVNSRTTSVSDNQSTESSATSSTELLQADKEENTGRDTLDFDLRMRIPEERVVSDMEWLCDQSGCLMLFHVQKELDALDTIYNRTWRSVGKVLLVSTQKLNLIETCYQSGKSPTEQLVEHLKTRGDEEPKMRMFVRALITCKKIDVARMICNWPWEMDINQANDSH